MEKIYLDHPGVYLLVESPYVRSVRYENPSGAEYAAQVAVTFAVQAEAVSPDQG
jgi:hypothetical protein